MWPQGFRFAHGSGGAPAIDDDAQFEIVAEEP
jgi:hypothetical protein